MKLFRYHSILQLFLTGILAFIFFGFFGCGSKPYNLSEPPPLHEVILGPGDNLEIKFSYTPELNEIQAVRPDGKIALQLIGEVDVKGKTPSELQSHLMSLYSTQLNNPDIIVLVRMLFSRRIYVSGDVRTPGVIEIPGEMTALEAVMAAGGFSVVTAAQRNVTVIRTQDGQRQKYTLDLKSKLQGKDAESFYLQPYDIVYVNENKFTKVNNFISNLVPRVLVSTFGIFLIGQVIN